MQVCVCPVIVPISNWMTDTSICELTKLASSLSSAPIRERERERENKKLQSCHSIEMTVSVRFEDTLSGNIYPAQAYTMAMNIAHTLYRVSQWIFECVMWLKSQKKRMFRMSFHLSGEKQFLCINKTQGNGNGNCHKIPIKVNRCCTMHNIFK